ncbi:MAG TPA: peptidase T [Firmicutes bacterium]|jgi:tripeptide aminopeptidase|nr:peptidase T [Bacillota bacterium]HAZ20732.1 peptidase T [Bacillota bacterium]HBR23614.1 peptidase T [Bacillota bacterium]
MIGKVNRMDQKTLLNEGLAQKLIRYAMIDTQSDENTGVTPSTPGQHKLAAMLADELKTLGLQEVKIDQFGFVTALLPGNAGKGRPVVGFLAHMDTVPGVPGKNVKPMVHQKYAGGDLHLPHGRVAVADNPLLAEAVGHDIITSDGSTLLGADNKAGVAEIMEAVCRMIKDPSMVHGDLKIAFTPDEEIGSGIGHFDVTGFGADVAYTLDGSAPGELEYENFNAANVTVVIKGVSTHTGTARNVMVNAVHLASELVASIPAVMRPETTDGYLGFIHPNSIEGNVEEVRLQILLRDFDDHGIEDKKKLLSTLVNSLEARYPSCQATIETTGGYQNMRKIIEQHPKVVELATKAIEETGLKAQYRPIRGGTDGARLTYQGLPCPNLFTGGINFHSRTEWASVQWMEKATATVINLARLWAAEKK